MGTQPRLPASGREATHPSILTTARDLAQSGTVGTFIDESLRRLEESFTGCLVSFNRIDLVRRTGAAAFRPYRADHDRAVDGVVRLLDEHPLYQWYTSQPDWSPVRISDVMPWEQFRQTPLLTEVLAPVGACHMIAIMLVPPSSGQFVYFGTTRADPDFTKDELVGEINKFGGSLAALEDMVSEHAYLFPGSRLNVTKLREEALATKKNVNQVWEEKYKVSEARAAREAADKKAYEDKLRKEGADAERAKFADQYGNPNLRTPEPSINTFAPRKEGERAGKQPWEVNQDLGMDRVRRATQKVIAEQSGRA